jgi:hypothetical protein
MAMTRIWRRDERVLWRRSGERRLLACPHSDELVVLDGAGALTWDLLAAPLSEQELIDALAAAHSSSDPGLSADVHGFMHDLHEAGAVRCG